MKNNYETPDEENSSGVLCAKKIDFSELMRYTVKVNCEINEISGGYQYVICR